MFYKKGNKIKETPSMNMSEKRHVQEDGIFDLRGIIDIKNNEYSWRIVITPFYISNADFHSIKNKRYKVNSRNYTCDGST